jgi:hypothetical protein
MGGGVELFLVIVGAPGDKVITRKWEKSHVCVSIFL